MVNIIACVDSKNGIGANNSLPWNAPAEMKWFKDKTLFSVVVMGRKTFESMNSRYLKNRINVVISKDSALIADLRSSMEFKLFCNKLRGFKNEKNSENFIFEIFDLIKNEYPNKEIFIIGGEKIYNKVLENDSFIKNIYLSRLKDDYKCDKFFPEINSNHFSLTDISHEDAFTIENYERITK